MLFRDCVLPYLSQFLFTNHKFSKCSCVLLMLRDYIAPETENEYSRCDMVNCYCFSSLKMSSLCFLVENSFMFQCYTRKLPAVISSSHSHSLY